MVSRMSDLDLAISDAADTVRMELGKKRMVDKAMQLALEIVDEFNLPEEFDVEDQIWDRIF